MNIADLLDKYHEWLPITVAAPHPENKLYIPAQMILVFGRDRYISGFSKFFDTEVKGKLDFDKQKSIEAVTRLALSIDLRLKTNGVHYPHPTTKRKMK